MQRNMYTLFLFAVLLGTALSYPFQQSNLNKVHRCAQPPASGLCLAYFPSFYYNPSTGICETFVYGGCQGNENRFVSQEACMEACGTFKMEEKEFKLRLESDEVQEQSSEKLREESSEQDSKESSEQDSNDALPESAEQLPSEQLPSEEQTIDLPSKEKDDPCSLPSEQGPCRAFFPRFYFNGDKCENFIFGGCEGNNNNFKTVEDCQTRCGSNASDASNTSAAEAVEKAE